MSEAAEKRIAELEREKRGLEEMLFHVLNEIGEPVEVPLETLKASIVGDKMIDVTLNEEARMFVFQVKDLSDAVQ